MLAHTLAQQAKLPHGLLGHLFAIGMRHMNRGINDWVVSLLNIKPDSRVLEIGFGPGQNIKKIAATLTSGRIAGIDLSDAMVRAAVKANRRDIQAGKVEIKKGEAANIPFPAESFDIAFCVNVIYFWSNPHNELNQIYKTCKPGGHIAIYAGDQSEMSNIKMTKTGVFNLYPENQISNLLKKSGFKNTTIHTSTIPQGPISKGFCIIGQK